MIPSFITRERLLEAIERIDRKGIPHGRNSRDYCLVRNGRHYPPKYTIALAHEIATGQLLPSSEFSGGHESNSFLQSRELEIAECNCGGITSPTRPRPNLARPVVKTPSKPQTHHEVSVYTVTLHQDGNDHTDAYRMRLLDEILAIISRNDSGPVILLPGGYFGSGQGRDEGVQRNLATVKTRISEMLKRLNSTGRVCLGIDGRSGKDQLAVAVSKDGIEALGRKYNPTDSERAYIQAAPGHLSLEHGYARVFTFLGRRWYMAVCYDVFGISQQRLSNPGVDVVVVAAHQFWPRGKGDSGDNYFARLGFAGASKQWGCPVFGTAVFFGKDPGRWPTGIVWRSGARLPRQCRYADNQLWPSDEVCVTSDYSKALIRKFDLR